LQQRVIAKAWLMTLVLLGGCQTMQPAARRAGASVAIETKSAWQEAATPQDDDKIGRVAAAWSEALADARQAGFSGALKAEGALLDPDAALARAAPPPGAYNCRLVKLGAQPKGGKAFVAYKPFFCFVGVSDDQLFIRKQGGSRRPGGYLYDTAETGKLIFLGSEALGTEDAPLAYGEDPERNMAGVLERVGDFRYRLVIPFPRGGSKLDVFELIPLPQQP
jgi:hypothetical protein